MNDDSLSDAAAAAAVRVRSPRRRPQPLRRFPVRRSHIMTAGKVRDRIAGLMLDIEQLRVVDEDTRWLQEAASWAYRR